LITSIENEFLPQILIFYIKLHTKKNIYYAVIFLLWGSY